MHQVRITNTVYDSGSPKYLGGQLYPVTEDTQRQVALRNGQEVDEPTDDELAAVEAAAKAQAEAAAQPAATGEAPAPAPAPAAPTPARKRAG